MRKSIIAAAMLLSVGATAQGGKFTIEGKLKNFAEPVEKIYLNYRVGSEKRVDSALVKNGAYTFSNSIVEPIRASLTARYAPDATGAVKKMMGRRDAATVFLSPATIKVTSTDSFSNVKITGSSAQTAFDQLDAQLKPYNDRMSAFMKRYNEADNEGKKKIEGEYDAIDSEMRQVYKGYVVKNPKSPVALYALTQFAGYDINAEEVQPVFDVLPATTKALPSASEFADRLAIASKLVIGKPAIDFTEKDTAGNPVSLSSLRGKVLLVDFWASWCGPCRRDNPNVVRVFNQYKDKGFDVLGVSLDQPGAKERWMKAIHHDKLTWTHVSDLKWWDSEVAKLYGVRAIPFNLLLDREGNIIGRNLHGEELEKKLSTIFTN